MIGRNAPVVAQERNRMGSKKKKIRINQSGAGIYIKKKKLMKVIGMTFVNH